MTNVNSAREILEGRFGFAGFLPGQAEAVDAVLAGDDVFVLWPTGAGKSLVYQLPALVRPGLTVVVSPLIALMRDQARKLNERGLPAAALHGDLAPGAYRKVVEGLEKRTLRLLYLAPERLGDSEALVLLRGSGVRALAVDEAHCVSQWGHEFRPDYRRIAAAAEALGSPQMIAATATASPRTRADIIENLFVRPPRLFAGSFRRPSIALSAMPRAKDSLRQLTSLVAARRGKSGIVYCASRRTADLLADVLAEAGHKAASYHAGLPENLRAARQDEFSARSDMVMTATIAFGLGVDKPDVRYVVHFDPPDHLESLYQETGRAGRDGLPAEGISLYSERSMRALRAARFALAGFDFAAALRARELSGYFLSGRCREQSLLAALGEAAPRCGRCDCCMHGGLALRQTLRLAAGTPREALAWMGQALAVRLRRAPEAAALPEYSGASALLVEEQTERLSVNQSRRLRRLRAERIVLARKLGVAPGQLISDEALIRMADSPPSDLAELIAVCGDGAGNLAHCGASLVEIARDSEI